MGLFASRQNATVEETDVSLNHLYKYPPRSGNYFGTHFIMGGERFDTPQPEAYLFGENADLNFLGSKPTPFPYPPPQATEPTKTLKSLVNIRKESVRFVKVAEGNNAKPVAAINSPTTSPTSPGNVEPGSGGIGKTTVPSGASNIGYNIEFVFDADYACLITIHYFCIEDIGPNGLSYLSRDSSISSETFRFQRGVNQVFSAPHHIVYPAMYAEDDLTYGPDKETLPVVIHCVVGDGTGGAAGTTGVTSEEMTSGSRQSHATICVIDHHSDGTYALRALKQKIFVDGLCYLLQEIYGIENKLTSKSITDEETEDNGSECVICMCDTRDTLILPCRHLCLCNSCADSLRYQANNCPICRAPFRALLQIRAVQKDVTGNGITCGSSGAGGGGGTPAAQNSTDGTDNIPAGYKTISLIEALNGPAVSVKAVTGTEGSGVVPAEADGNRSNENGFGFRSKLSKSSTDHSSNGELANGGSLVSDKSSGGVATSDVRMQLLTTTDGEGGGLSVSVAGDGAGAGAASSASAAAPVGGIICSKKELLSKHSPLMQRAPMSKDKNPREKGHRIANANNSSTAGGTGKTIKSPSDKPIGFHLVHEKPAMKPMTELTENDDDSDVDKAAPLLRKSGSYEGKKHPDSSAMKKLLIGGNGVGGMLGSDGPLQGIDKSSPTAVITELLKGAILGDVGNESNGLGGMERDAVRGSSAMITIVADDSEDYYTPEDPPLTSPLKAMDDDGSSPRELLGGGRKPLPLPTGATTANVVVPPPPPSALSVLKEEQSLQGSLPDSPISGNSQTSTRSSSDSYSSSSSTRQLLSSGAVPNDTPTHALSSVDSTTNGNSAVSKIAECSIESD